jgi:hypothetical protein
VRLVEDHRIARGQQLSQAFVAQGHVGEEQVMVDDDDVGVERVLARLHHEAFAMECAVAAEAVLARRRHHRPYPGVFGDVGELGAVAPFACPREGDDLRQVARVVARRQPSFACGALEVVMADVVRASLEQRDADRDGERVADQRQVALEELILQRLGAGRYDDLAAVEQRRNEIRERLAGAGARFRDQRQALSDRARDGLRHCELLWPEPETGQRARERAAVAEDRGELRVRRACRHVLRQRRVQCFSGFARGFDLTAFFAVVLDAALVSSAAMSVRMPSMRRTKSSYGFATRAL